MRIVVIDSRGKIISILNVEEYTTILEIKKMIGDPNIQLKFDGMILKDNKTISDYEIEEDDKIISNYMHVGGETGTAAKSLSDPTKSGPKKIKTVTEGPFYLTVDDGINLFGNCYNKNCQAYQKEVCHIFGFGTFDLIKDLDPQSSKCPKCPACELPLLRLETCGFMNCKYSYIGSKFEDGTLKPINYNESISIPDTVDYFLAGDNGENKSLFVELKITASKL